MHQAVLINLTENERVEFHRLCRSGKTPARLKERLSIVLLADEGLSNTEISEHVPASVHKIARWRNRFAEHGFAGIEKDLPRGANHGGADSVEQARLRKKIIAMTTDKDSLPKEQTHWTTRTLAKTLGINHMLVSKVWKEYGLKPHLVSQFKVSNDPLFEEKLVDVVGLYMNLQEKAAVFCVDEKSSIQALDRTPPGLPMKKGRAATNTHDYKRHGTSTLFAALNMLTGEVIGECEKRHRHQEFLSFLETVEKQTPEGLELHVIVDNYATHKHKKVKNWLQRNKRVTLHLIPTSSSWLNLVERFFGLIIEQTISRGGFTSVKELEAKIQDHFEADNTDPNPFVWTESAEATIERAARAKDTLI